MVHCDVKVGNPRFMSGPACSSICRDRHHRHRNLIHFPRRTIRRIAMTTIGNDHWRGSLRGVILQSDSHGAAGAVKPGHSNARNGLTATERHIMEARGTPLISKMTAIGIVSIGRAAVGR